MRLFEDCEAVDSGFTGVSMGLSKWANAMLLKWISVDSRKHYMPMPP